MTTLMTDPPLHARSAPRETSVFLPELVYFEPAALDYPKGRRILDYIRERGLP